MLICGLSVVWNHPISVFTKIPSSKPNVILFTFGRDCNLRCMQSAELHVPDRSQGPVACYSSLYGFGHIVSNVKSSFWKWKVRPGCLCSSATLFLWHLKWHFHFVKLSTWSRSGTVECVWRVTTAAGERQQQAKSIIKPIEWDTWYRADHHVVTAFD